MDLSVALCTYNGALFIESQLLSILNQRLPVDEIVIYDDGSSDATLSMIHSISEKHPEVVWEIRQNPQRLGVIKNFEKALLACHGDIIFLSDQDDIWLPEKTEKMVAYFHQHPNTELLFTDAVLIDENGRSLSDNTLFDVTGLTDVMDMWDAGLQFEIENVFQRLLGATFAIRKSFLPKCTPFHTNILSYHDGQMAMQSVVENSNGWLDECLTQYRIHSRNVCGLGGNDGGRLTRKRAYDDRYSIIEPRDVKPFFLLPCAGPIESRVHFYIKRNRHYSSCVGKILLALSVFSYIKYYHQFWPMFYFSDLLYGVSNKLRRKLVFS